MLKIEAPFLKNKTWKYVLFSIKWDQTLSILTCLKEMSLKNVMLGPFTSVIQLAPKQNCYRAGLNYFCQGASKLKQLLHKCFWFVFFLIHT